MKAYHPSYSSSSGVCRDADPWDVPIVLPRIPRWRLSAACSLAYEAGLADKSFSEALQRVRDFLMREPDESVESRLPSELRAAWQRGKRAWHSVVGVYLAMVGEEVRC